MGVLHGNRGRVEPPGPNLVKSRDPLADPIITSLTRVITNKHTGWKHYHLANAGDKNNFIPTITVPTRVTDNTATLIDHIFINNKMIHKSPDIESGVIYCGLTDHLPIFINLTIDCPLKSHKRPILCPSHLFHHVPIIVSSWNFQELLPWSEVMPMQKVKVKGQGHRGQHPT